MSDVRDQLREQMLEAFGGADYPVSNQMDLLPALPDGPGTRFETDEVSFTVMELATKLADKQDFPYDDVESLVEDVLDALEDKGMI